MFAKIFPRIGLAACTCLFVSTQVFAVDDVLSPKAINQLLEQRVAGKWSSLVERDIDSVYQYTSPSYRKLFSKEYFGSKLGVSIHWLEAKLVDVDMDMGGLLGRSEVKVVVDYRLALPEGVGLKLNDEVGRITSQLSEVWIWNDNQWWYVPSDESL